MAYPTTAALVAASTVPELTSLTAAQQDSLRAAAIVAVEAYTGQSFEPFVGTHEVRSLGGSELFLPQRLEAFTAITQNGVTLEDTASVSISEDGSMIRLSPPAPNYYEQALYEISGGDYPRAWGEGFVSITGTWGWSVTPPEVELALRYDMEDQALADANALSATVNVARKLGLKDIAQGNLRVALATAPTLTTRTEQVLAPLIWHGGGGRTV